MADPISRNPALLAAAVTRSQRASVQGQAPAARELPAEGQHPEQTVHADGGRQQDVDLSDAQEGTLLKQIKAGYATDEWFSRRNLRKLVRHADGTWRLDDKVVVPNCKEVKLRIMREAHDPPVTGHVGRVRTQHNVQRSVWWPSLHSDVQEYVRTCDLCQRNKSTNQKPGGLLMPLPIPTSRCQDSISMDLITALPRTSTGKDAIVVFVDRLSKMTHFVAITTDIGSQGLADVFIDSVVKHHGVPSSIISDRDPRFTGKFWQAVMKRLGTHLRMSTAFHPQSDGQTERMNIVLEDMLRSYVDPNQDDWDQHLPMAEFAVNNSVNQSTRQTPFYLNYGEHPRTPLDLQATKSTVPAAKLLCDTIQGNLRAARTCLQQAQQRMSTVANKKRRDVTYRVGDKVMLNTRNIRLKVVGTPKLLPRWVGPFRVGAVISRCAVRLDLPAQ
jgi:hypothetical protein